MFDLEPKISNRVLVVDDDASQRAQLAGFLEDLGAEVVEAKDGREALALVPGLGPDVVITDLRMPELDGQELLREIQQLQQSGDAAEANKIVVFRHEGSKLAVDRCLSGAHLIKGMTLNFNCRNI